MHSLEDLGWHPFFSSQAVDGHRSELPPVRVMEVHRDGMIVAGDEIDDKIPPRRDVTVGDWLLFDGTLPKASELLKRKSLIKRQAPGQDKSTQLIAANIDTAFIVTSCNQEFSVARLERYVALVFEAEVTPVIVLTKPDLCDDTQPFIDAAKTINETIEVLVVNAKSAEAPSQLKPWCSVGQTVVFLGSSGVGKSTLTNGLLQSDVAETGAVRDDDAKGRHTTRHRQLHIMENGCAVLDTPGMRELQLTDAADGVAEVFLDLEELATQCKFNDCLHEAEPGCAIKAALEKGSIDAERFARWQKLAGEEKANSNIVSRKKLKESTNKTFSKRSKRKT